MLKQLRRWLQYKDRYRQSRYVFCTNKGKSLKVTNYETNFRKYGKRMVWEIKCDLFFLLRFDEKSLKIILINIFE